MKWLWRLGRLSSHRPIVLALVMLPTVSLLVLAGLSAWRTATDSEARVVEQRVTLARSVAQASSSFVNGHLSTVRSLALTRAITAPESQPGLEGFLQRVLAANSDWDSFGLYAEDGWTIVSTAAPPRGVNVADRPYFQQVLVSGAPVISPALVSRTTGRPVVALAAPVPFAGGGRGVLIAALATTNLRKALDALYGGEDFEIVVVDQQGQVLVHPDPVVVRALQPLGDRQAVIDVLAGGSGSYRSGAQRPRGSGGVEQLTTYAPLSGLDWGVLISQPAAVAFGPARRQLTLELVLLGLAAALTSSIAWLLGGRLARFYELQQAVAAQLSRQLAFTSAITRHLGEGVYALDRSGRLTFMNPAAERMLGWAEAELLGKPMHDIIHCRRNDESADTSRIAAAEDCPIVDVARRGVMVQEHDDNFVRRDGTSLPVAYTSSPIIAGNEIVGAVVAFHDITTSKESEAALRDAARMREEFLAMVSHELRTPLTAVMGYADILLRQRHGALNERQLRHAAGIREAAHRQLALVNDLLDVSKLEAGKVELRLRPVDCQAAITRAAAAMQVIAAEKGVELRVATADRAAPPALADDDRLHQILVNLLSNAIKFTPREGTVTIGAVAADQASHASSGVGWSPLLADGAAPQGTVEFRVQDSGVGIAPDHLTPIWDRFYQADSSSTRRFGGTGLGLAIVKRLTELHGGQVQARSVGVGEGSTFSVWLPVASTGVHALTPLDGAAQTADTTDAASPAGSALTRT